MTAVAHDSLYVEVRGDGPDLVLLHGWALHGGTWGPWLDVLATHARLHIVDLPGHGRSRWLESTSDLASLARAVSTAVPRGAGVLGWSLGGLVALELARVRPGEIGPLILVATTPCFLERVDWAGGMRPEVLAGFATGLVADYRRTIASFLAMQSWGDERASETLRALRAALDSRGEPDPRALQAGLDILRDADLRDALPGIRTPALVISGENDRITPAEAGAALAARLPAARHVQVAKAGHAPFLSHADAVLAEVIPFLQRTRRPPSTAALTPETAPTTRDGSSARGHDSSRVTVADEAALTLDMDRVARAFTRAARQYDAAAVLQARVREELLERLEVVRLEPAVVVDAGTGTGHGAIALKRRYPKSRVVAIDLALGMLREAGHRQTLLRRFHRVVADAAALPVGTGTIDMVFSSLMLQWCNDPDAVFRECRRVLRPGGVLTFTTLGPDTLCELRRSWQAADPAHAHVNRFIDMHDVGDALLRAGFAEPVLDVERYTLTYEDARDLMRDLKTIGAHNANVGRAAGLTGKATFARVMGAYERYRVAGRLPATYEVVFGQAWSPAHSKVPQRPGEYSIPLAQIGRHRRA